MLMVFMSLEWFIVVILKFEEFLLYLVMKILTVIG
jgi:hypothetical protein